MPCSSLVIAKFGGTSVANHEAMQRCADLVKSEINYRLIVTSAPAGITNYLVKLGQNCLDESEVYTIISQIRDIALGIAEYLSQKHDVEERLIKLLSGIEHLVSHEDLTSSLQLQDELFSYGERIASLLLTAVFCETGIDAQEFDVRQVMTTDESFGAANPDINQLLRNTDEHLRPLLGDKVIITQGFLGRTAQGKTTTLGRGGSDYTAALLAEALGALKCDIWTDVAGVFSTDPRIVKNAYPLSELSFDEAAEMANFGAKVLHPATLAPTLRQNIPVFVGCTAKPELGGTTIVRDCQREPTFRAITRRREQKLITLHTPKLERASQFIGLVFTILDHHGLSVDLITTSETYISLTFNAYHSTNLAESSANALDELREHCIVEIEDDLDLITVVGNHLNIQPGGAGGIFEVLDSVRIRMICYGANPHNISFLVEQDDSTTIVQTLHKHLLEPS